VKGSEMMRGFLFFGGWGEGAMKGYFFGNNFEDEICTVSSDGM
jgi:hypothetical protein